MAYGSSAEVQQLGTYTFQEAKVMVKPSINRQIGSRARPAVLTACTHRPSQCHVQVLSVAAQINMPMIASRLHTHLPTAAVS